MKRGSTAQKNRDYMTRLFRYRSIIALVCCCLTLLLAFYGITAGVNRTADLGKNGFFAFAYFTMLANMFAAVAAAFVIPFAAEGVRNKRLILPGWVAVAHHLSATSIAIVMIFVLVFVSRVSPFDAFGESNIFLHVYCPVLILIAFFQTENGYIYTIRDRLIGCIPFFIYSLIYFVKVVLIGEANGGWPDLYRITEFMSPALAFPLMLLFAFGISSLVAVVSNWLTGKRAEKMYQYWNKDADPIDARIEAYGLGGMAAQYADENSLQIPLDILRQLERKCGLNQDDLVRPYIIGFLNERKERASLKR